MEYPTRRRVLAAGGAAAFAASAGRSSVADPVPPHADATVLRLARRRIGFSRTIAILKREIPIKMMERDVPGLAVGLVQGGNLVWAEGFGSTGRATHNAVTPDTLFSLQSMSKGYTAVGVMRAVERGWLKLDDRLIDHMPDFRVESRFGSQEYKKITFRHLLSHFAGLCHEAPVGNNYDDRPCSFAEHVASISGTWLKHPVGDRYAYSNLGIDLAGFVLEQHSGTAFERYMQDSVLDPIGMRASTFDQDKANAGTNVARGNIGVFEVPPQNIPMRAAGGLYSNVRDMAQFVSFQLARGLSNAQRILSSDSVDEMQRPQFPIPGQIGGYGLGLISIASRGAYAILHGGGGYGFNSDHRWIPDYGIGVVVACNQESGSPAPVISSFALRLMIGELLEAIPVTTALSPILEPTVAQDPAELRKLAGTYQRRSSLAKIAEKDGWLVLDDGSYLDAHGDDTFSNASMRYRFERDPSGAVERMHVVGSNFSENASEYWPLNDTPTDTAGPNRGRWASLVGKYLGRETSKPMTVEVLMKNGYLYLDGADTPWQGGIKLSEHTLGLFFTSDGEAVKFDQGRISLGNRPFFKA